LLKEIGKFAWRVDQFIFKVITNSKKHLVN